MKEVPHAITVMEFSDWIPSRCVAESIGPLSSLPFRWGHYPMSWRSSLGVRDHCGAKGGH